MYSDPQQALALVLQRQEEMRVQIQREAEARRVTRPSRKRSPTAFKFLAFARNDLARRCARSSVSDLGSWE
jgi:hypothetical protein